MLDSDVTAKKIQGEIQTLSKVISNNDRTPTTSQLNKFKKKYES